MAPVKPLKASGRAAASSLAPSAEEASETQYFAGALVWSHVEPESGETKIGFPEMAPPAPSTNLVPSAEQAAQVHEPKDSKAIFVQSIPKFVERQLEGMKPPGRGNQPTAMNVFPSPEMATESQGYAAFTFVHVVPEFEDV